MIKFIKNLFKSTPGQGMVPIQAEPVEREYVYMGDGMMEEVIRPHEAVKACNVGPGSIPINANELKERVRKVNARQFNSPNYTGNPPTATHYDVSNVLGASAAVTVMTHSDPSYTPTYDSSYDSGYSSCDSGYSSPSCD